MLKQLYIKNFTLIDTLNIEFRNGFSVITGETGAGKSIILGAIGLLTGQRADTKAIKQGADRCIIEAHFDLSNYSMEGFFKESDIDYDATDCIIRRELNAAGKSRAFINDSPTTLSVLKDLGEQLIDIHSQHQNLLIGKQDFQMEVVDIIAADKDELNAYAQSYNYYRRAERKLAELRDTIERDKSNADFLQFQYNELSSANLIDGEQEELEQQAEVMSHAEDIKSALYEADKALSDDEAGMLSLLKKSANALSSIESMLPTSANDLATRLNNSYIEIKDIAEETSRLLENTDFDPKELDRANERLDTIYTLQKKYKRETVAELLQLQETLKRQLSQIENSDEELQALQASVSEAKANCDKRAKALTEKRRKAAKEIERQMLQRLSSLGMPNVRFSVSIEPCELGSSGADKVAFLFSANKSTQLQPVSQVASGGEIARVMLSLKAMISGAVKLPTIIFDEIDTGVSGKIAEKMAQIMQQMGRTNRQVISITHLPQIAALGTTHYKVVKRETDDGTTSSMTMLSNEERVTEIAQMLSGSDVTEAAINNAKELLRL